MWAAALVLILSGLAFGMWLNGNPPRLLDEVVPWSLPLLWAAVTYRLGCAYRDYLGFDHPWATVILSQVIVGLIAFITAGTVLAILEGR
jgi:hypothetical protein